MKFKLVKGFISKQEADNLYKNIMNDDNLITNDKQIPNTPSWYNNKSLINIHKQLTFKMSELFKKELVKTYCYCRMYKKGDILHPHTDRPACEYSATVNLGRKGKNWAIKVLDDDLNTVSFMLEPGDAVIYKGCEVMHWREIFDGEDMGQVFFHYVDKNGEYAWAENDNEKP